ncbi:DNA methyltransferase 1-associated protein 1-like [Limulus polyphemus]|uniref:DNA methyltransferase 1-associated protein 1-like n=1 Tax=Limulus polyphemus TaxID=6850 RepID=A0ABM1BY67_LIMPO|nr:DNA methyltransferase 1-associated protein 1-like [Limulus polyphemus]
MSDVLDILDIERPQTPEHNAKESIFGSEKKKKKKILEPTFKKPEGMHRELYALLYYDNKDPPPLLPSDTGQGYKQVKAKLGLKKVRPWRWLSFSNSARKDGALFCHWRRVADEGKDYPFAKFNKTVQVPSYSDAEYQQHLMIDSWARQETDHLFDLCRRFDLRFIVVHDRWDKIRYPNRSVEDLKERYYNICNILSKVRAQPGQEPKLRGFDADHERRRKEQLKKLFDRTPEQVEEEQTLINELRKIEMRKREREKKTQDLQKLITAADNNAEARKTERRGPRKKLLPQKSSKADGEPLETGIKFPDFKASGATLRSQRMKLPSSVGQKKAKAIEQLLQELGIDLNPMPTEDICTHFSCKCQLQFIKKNHITSELIVWLLETLSIPSTVTGSSLPQAGECKAESPNKQKTISEIIDVGGTPGTPNRKRRAALEQSNILKKIKKL